MKKLFLFLLVLSFFNAYATEEIRNFHSQIKVNQDRSITVTETITVKAEGVRIQRGIFRDIVTTAKNEAGKRIKYNLEVVEVLKNGEPENYSVTDVHEGKQIRIGNADIFLSPGEYTYAIKYNMANQVRFFSDYDELYWNVTGRGWDFEILHASATVQLPDGATILHHQGYSGSYGETGCNCTFEKPADNVITYQMTSSLYPRQELTVAIGWNKGIIPPPTEAELRKDRFMAQLPLYSGVGGTIIIFLYYLFAWFRVGRDPAKGAIIPRFDPPHGYSPAASRFVNLMRFDKKAFTASIVSMAVKGYLTIDQSGKNYKLLKLTNDTSALSAGEKKIAAELFKNTDSFTITQSNHSKLSRAISSLESQLKADFMKINFNNNIWWLVPGILLSIAVGVALFVLNLDDIEVIISMIVGFFIFMFMTPFMAIFYNLSRNTQGAGKYLFLIFFLAIPAGFAVLAYNLILEFDSGFEYLFRVGPFLIIFILLIVLNALFFYLIKAPTVSGRKIMDEIEGLKMFMEVAEKHRLNALNPPEMTPQLFERLLPYAIALNVENAWGKQFDSIIEKAIQNNEYQPRWYQGGTGDIFRANALASTLGGSFSSSISSASISPQSSSSSGSRGGGSSGGGGGGGGGGGW